MEVGQEIIQQGLEEALATMKDMCANEGQLSVYDSQVVDAFTENAQATVDEGWQDVDIGGYMDFMGQIVEEGNSIMQNAYEQAAIESEIEGYFF